MAIIDVHSHCGYDEVFEEEFMSAELVEAQERWGVDVTIVQPGTTLTLATVQRQHDAIAELSQRHPGRFYGMANPNPRLPQDEYRGEIIRCVRDLGFVGIKLHTFAHAISPTFRAAHKVFAVAQELSVPVMIHTGSGAPFALLGLVLGAGAGFPKRASCWHTRG